METKTHWKKLTNPDYIGAYSLQDGQDLVVTIDRVVRELVTSTGGKKEECTVAYLVGQKPLILNRTNSKMIQQIYGTPYIEDWSGKRIQLYATVTKLKGEEVECLRIRPTEPNQTKPVLLITDSENFNKVKKAVENGYTLAQIKIKWIVPEETQIALNL